MIYHILFSETAGKQFLKLEKPIQKRIITALEKIRFRPDQFVRRLVGDKAYRLRVGNYRVLMDIQKNNLLILVIKIGHRKNIYK